MNTSGMLNGDIMTIAWDVVDCLLGKALIAATPLGLCCVRFGSSERELVDGLREEYSRATLRRDAGLLRFAREGLARVLAGRAADPLLPLDVRATAFQARVWAALRAIPAGETRTYSEIARALGRPRAARAVARACASNPVAVLIPCHRVVPARGGVGGYRWGAERKRRLLDVERGAGRR